MPCQPIESQVGRVAIVTDSVEREALEGLDLYAGKEAFEVSTSSKFLYDGTGWICMYEPLQAYTSWATSGLTVGSGVKAGWTQRHDGWCRTIFQFTAAADSEFSGNLLLDLRYAAKSGNPNLGIWTGGFIDAAGSANRYQVLIDAVDSNTIEMAALLTSGTNGSLSHVTASNPMNMDTGDLLYVSGDYPMVDAYQ